MLLIQLVTILCPIILCFMKFFDLLSKKIQKWPKTGFFCKIQFLAIFGFFNLTNQKNTINIKWRGIKSSLVVLVTLGQNIQSSRKKSWNQKNICFLPTLMNPPSFYTPCSYHKIKYHDKNMYLYMISKSTMYKKQFFLSILGSWCCSVTWGCFIWIGSFSCSCQKSSKNLWHWSYQAFYSWCSSSRFVKFQLHIT